jgi:amidase
METITKDMSWQDIAAIAQAYRDESIARVQPVVPDPPTDLPLNLTSLPAKLLPKHVVEITESPTERLLQQMASGNLTSTEVTQAFLQRAGLASKLVNCITELLPERSLQRAADLDKYYAQHGKPIGPLHGLPISVKEHIAMKDLDLNAGFVSWVGNVAQDDGLILKLLWNAGCVFHARTTEPQTLMHLETSSNIYGVTLNPHNTNLTSGGSSGGEGALLGIRGSCLGIGTDIGGSIRSPAANQGLFGFKPTSYRLPLDGFAATMLGQEQIVPVVGPLSTSLEGIKIFMETLIDQKPWLYEPSLVPMPWKDSTQRTLVSNGVPKLKQLHRKIRMNLTNTNIKAPHQPPNSTNPPHRHPSRRPHRKTAPTHPPCHLNPSLQPPIPPQHNHNPLPGPLPRQSLGDNQQPILLRRRSRRESRDPSFL